MQLRFASFAVINLREDFHLRDRAHAGRTRETGRSLRERPVVLDAAPLQRGQIAHRAGTAGAIAAQASIPIPTNGIAIT